MLPVHEKGGSVILVPDGEVGQETRYTTCMRR